MTSDAQALTLTPSASDGGPSLGPRRTVTNVQERRVDVLHVAEAFGGGVETAMVSFLSATPQLRHQVLARQRRGHETHVFAGSAHEVDFVDGGLGAFTKSLIAAVRTYRPRVIHAHSSFAGVLVRALPNTGFGIVYSPHCYAAERSDLAPWKRAACNAVERAVSRRPHVVAALSPHEGALARRLNGGAEVMFVPNATSVTPRGLTHGGRAAFPLKTGLHAVTVGRILPQKDPLFLASALRIAGLGDRLTCEWIGDGDLGLRRELESAGVTVTGWLPNAEVRQRVSAADVYLSSAAWEGSPMSLLEAAHDGLPVLARDIPSLRSLGYPVAGHSPESFAQALVSYVDQQHVRDRVRDETRHVAEAHTLGSQSARLIACYSQAIRQAARRHDSVTDSRIELGTGDTAYA